MKTIFVIQRPDGTPFQRDDAMGILATDSEAQAIRFAYVREDEGAEVVRYATQPPHQDRGEVDGNDLARHLFDTALRAHGLHHEAYHVGCGAELDSHDQAAIDAIDSAISANTRGFAAQAEQGAIRALVTAANAVLALHPEDDGMWTLELAVRPFNVTKPSECANGCPANTVCDYCQIAALTEAKQQGPGEAVRHDAESWGNALNEAAWVFVEQCPEKSALLFNNTKAPLRAAILKYLELVGPTAPQVEAKRQTGGDA